MMCRLNRMLQLLLLLALAGSVFAIGDLDDPAKKLLRHVSYYPDKRVQRVTTYYLGPNEKVIPHGFDLYFYDLPGNIKSQGTTYVRGQKQGKFVSWYESGKECERGMFDHDKRAGTWTMLYESGAKKQELQYLNDQKQGVFTSWYENGQVQATRTYVRDQRQGQEIRYYDTGKVKSKVYWANDKLEGKALSFYPDGKPKVVASYAGGQLNGALTELYKDGSPRLSCEYVDGKLNGAYEAHMPSGTLVGKGTFRDGHIVDGMLREEGSAPNQFWLNTYVDGQVTDGTLYEDGQPKDGEVKEFYPTGTPMRMYLFVDGKRNGQELWWYADGKVMKDFNWKNNKLNGAFSEFWPDGTPSWVATFDNGKRVGVETRFDHRGHIIARGEYKDGKPYEGTFAIVADDGDQILKKYAAGVQVDESGNEVTQSEEDKMKLTSKPEMEADGRARRWKISTVKVLTPEEMARESAKATGNAPMEPTPVQ